MHPAFKCTYCDGGQGDHVGFSDTCSDETIVRNVEEGRIWCNSGPCRDYYDSDLTGEKPDCPCYESSLFTEWWFSAGIYRSADRDGTPIPMKQAGVGDIAVFTTRFPYEPREDQRRVIGLFIIGELQVDDGMTIVSADPNFRVRFPMSAARELYFWDYFRNSSGGPKWGTGLFRYLSDDQVARLIADAQYVIDDANDKVLLESIYEVTFGGSTGTAPFPYARYPEGRRVPQTVKVVSDRKYGELGESDSHLALKEQIANRPKLLGLSGVREAELDSHIFRCGDRPDIVFHLADGRTAVVEIETAFPWPGAYQAIKYRSLACAELGKPLDSPDVLAYLVAWDMPADVKAFCNRYGIHAKAIRG